VDIESAPLQRVRVFDAFRHRDFRLLWSGQFVSLIGDAAFFTALGWRAFTLVGSSRLGIVFLAQAIGLLTTLLIGGALADRIPRRTMMIASDLSRFVVVGTLAVVDATGHLTFTVLLVLTFLNGLGDGFFFPAVGGIVPLVVEQSALPSANSLIGVARWGSFIIGPGARSRPVLGDRVVRRLRPGRCVLPRLCRADLATAGSCRATRRQGGDVRRDCERRALRLEDSMALGNDHALRRDLDAPARTAAGADAGARPRAFRSRRRRVRVPGDDVRRRHGDRHAPVRAVAAAQAARRRQLLVLAGQ
jgi:hypothetical protein